MTDYEDVPVDQLIEMMTDVLKLNPASLCFVRFTCPNCGSRQTSDKPNEFCVGGYSCEGCKKIVFPEKYGFSLIARLV